MLITYHYKIPGKLSGIFYFFWKKILLINLVIKKLVKTNLFR